MNIKINLLPIIKKKKVKKGDTNLIIIFIFFILILGLIYFFYYTKINSLTNNLTTIQQNINKYKDMETLKNEKIKSDTLLNYYINTINKLGKNQVKFSQFFNTLSQNFPKYAYLTNLDVDLDTKVVRLVGVVDDYYNLGRLLNYLSNFKLLNNVYLSNFSKQVIQGQEGKSTVTFTIIGIWNVGAQQ
jgi:Tfp pilus assembly protein PilN